MEKLSQLTRGGLVLGMSEDGKKLYCNTDDTHSLIIGATRSGKSQHIVLPSIGVMAMAGESMVVVDPKAELYLSTQPYLERLGYETIVLDFKEPLKSDQYNFLQPVIDAVNLGDSSLAITRARDIATILVPDGPAAGKTEPIWIHGERSILTASILAVVMENQQRPEFQNLSNAYRFIVEMGKPGPGGAIPLSKYVDALPRDHPVRLISGVSEVAPSKTRGSFYASGSTTLNLFTDPAIHTMTSATGFDLYATAAKKRAIFLVLPDYKETYYPLAALFVYQHYQTLSELADKRGGRLPRRVNFVCDEFGNFAKIPNFLTMLTVSGGRGIRFHLFLQDFNQLDEKYGREVGKSIRSNAETWIYLQTDNLETLEELSRKLGKYTVKTSGASGSTTGGVSASYNYTGRDLLTADEIKRIRRPYQLVTSRSAPCIMYAPMLSKTVWSAMYGLGDEAHDRNVRRLRNDRRQSRKIQTAYWGIWTVYQNLLTPRKESDSHE